MKLGNLERAKDVIESYREAKNAHDSLARLEYQRAEMRDENNEETYLIQIRLLPINSNQPPVEFNIQNRALEWSAIQIIKDAYEYHKKQVESL